MTVANKEELKAYEEKLKAYEKELSDYNAINKWYSLVCSYLGLEYLACSIFTYYVDRYWVVIYVKTPFIQFESLTDELLFTKLLILVKYRKDVIRAKVQFGRKGPYRFNDYLLDKSVDNQWDSRLHPLLEALPDMLKRLPEGVKIGDLRVCFACRNEQNPLPMSEKTMYIPPEKPQPPASASVEGSLSKSVLRRIARHPFHTNWNRQLRMLEGPEMEASREENEVANSRRAAREW